MYTGVANDSITIPDYLEHRFADRSKLLRVLPATVTLVFFAFYTSAGMVAGAVTVIVIVWKQLSDGIFEMFEILPGSIICSAASYGVSLMERLKRP